MRYQFSLNFQREIAFQKYTSVWGYYYIENIEVPNANLTRIKPATINDWVFELFHN